MNLINIISTLPSVIALIGVVFTEIYKFRKYKYSKTSDDVLLKVYKPLHQLLQHYIYKNNYELDPLSIYNKYFERISDIIQNSYEFTPPTLYNSYYNLINIDNDWIMHFKNFCKLVDIGYNQYRKLLRYPHKSILSEYNISCYSDKLILRQVFWTKIQFYINSIIIIYIGIDNTFGGPLRSNLSNIRFIIFVMFILLLTLYHCFKYLKMYRDNPFCSYPLF